MPQAKRSRTQDGIVAKLVSDPAAPPKTALLSGFIGASSEKGHTRVYLDPELSAWVDVPDTAILHTEPMAESVSPLGGSYVWIARDAEVVHGPAAADAARGRFFEGPIADEFQPQGVPTMWPCTHWMCPPSTRDATCSTFACPTSPIACHTRQVNCPTHVSCPTGPFECPTRICPSGFQCQPPVAERGIPTAWPCTLWACPPNTSAAACPPRTYGPPCPAPTYGPPCPPGTAHPQCPPPPTSPHVCRTLADPACHYPTRPSGCTPAPEAAGDVYPTSLGWFCS